MCEEQYNLLYNPLPDCDSAAGLIAEYECRIQLSNLDQYRKDHYIENAMTLLSIISPSDINRLFVFSFLRKDHRLLKISQLELDAMIDLLIYLKGLGFRNCDIYCIKRTHPATHDVFIRPPVTHNIRPVKRS